MIIKDPNIYWNIPCFNKELENNKIEKFIPIPSIMSYLDEGISIEETAKNYKLATENILEVIKYVEEFGRK